MGLVARKAHKLSSWEANRSKCHLPAACTPQAALPKPRASSTVTMVSCWRGGAVGRCAGRRENRACTSSALSVANTSRSNSSNTNQPVQGDRLAMGSAAGSAQSQICGRQTSTMVHSNHSETMAVGHSGCCAAKPRPSATQASSRGNCMRLTKDS